MKKVATYISFSLILCGVSLAGQKDKGSFVAGHAAINFNESTLTEESSATVDRKRAHKRKRRIRPRRNGF